MSNSLKEAWDSYVKQCMPKRPHPIQYTETRRAFYGGANVALAISKNPQMAISLANELKEFLREEVERFEAGYDPTAEAPIEHGVKRRIAVDHLRCQATGYDDESCRSALSIFDESKDVAIAMFSMLQKLCPGNNQHCMQCTVVGMQSLLAVIRQMNR